MEREKPELDWQVTAGLLPKAEAKLLLNLLIIALNSVARGGKITVTADRDAGETVLRVVAEGDRANYPRASSEVIAEGAMPNPLDAHAVQPLYTALLAKEARMGVTATQEENRVVLGAGA